MKTIDDFNFEGKKALIRVDFNVPLDGDFNVTDTSRIDAAKPSILKVLEDGGSAILMSHMGRPKGKVNPAMSLSHITETVSNIIGVQVKFVEDCVGTKAEEAVAGLQSGEVLLLENLRFHAAEEAGDEAFAEQLSKHGDVYVNDAFGTAHRAHASTTIVAKFFPENKCFGYLLAKEIKAIDKVMETGEKPVTAILGGAKVSSKITIIENILDKVDNLIIGGGMTYTFVKANGGEVGDSICENDYLETAKNIEKLAKEKGVNLIMATDVLAADAFDENANTKIMQANEIPEGWQGLDAGPNSIAKFKEVIENSATILWNGPVGVFEMDKFADGSKAVGEAIVKATEKGAFSLVGGGDSVACVNKFNMADGMSYISTAGGALLEYLEGRTLPGVAAVRGE